MLENGTEIDKYLIIEHLGHGHFGNVYRAHDRALDHEKAIKILDLKDPNEFLDALEEAQILNKCRHKNIVRVNEANVYHIEGKPSVVIDMELINGPSLEKLLQTTFISAIDATSYIIDVLFALEHAHNHNILHRDIKPGNILLDGKTGKLSDFGLATALGSADFASPRGYTTHLAPETFSDGVTSVETDIFAVGITLFRLVCNVKNWKRTVHKIQDVEKAIRNGALVCSIGYPLYVPSKIIKIINKACHKSPNKRYSSAAKMRQALERLKPNINWVKTGSQQWTGSSWQGAVAYHAEIIHSRLYEVVFKKNRRRMNEYCNSFKEEAEALSYLKEIISSSKFH